jgi:hypothetical protein
MYKENKPATSCSKNGNIPDSNGMCLLQVSFFNNYLMDPKRPALQEHPKNKQKEGPSREQFSNPSGGFQAPPQQGMMGYSQPMAPPMRSYGE